MHAHPIRAPRRVRWRRPLLVGAVTAAVLLAIGILPGDRRPGIESAPAAAIELAPAAGGVAAVSDVHGPHAVDGGRARGFAHDELGAAVAASNIAARVSPAATAPVYEATLREQCWGDVDAALATLRTTVLAADTPAHGDLDARALHYRILAGDPLGEHVVVSLLADTPQARTRGGLARVDTTLRWSGGDWQLRVPVQRPTLHPGTAGYTLLAGTP